MNPNDTQAIQSQLESIFAKVMRDRWEAREITAETRLREDLNFDSLDAIETVSEVEDRFGLTVSDQVAASIQNVGDIVALIRSGAPSAR